MKNLWAGAFALAISFAANAQFNKPRTVTSSDLPVQGELIFARDLNLKIQ